ncbi:rCG34949 [Rattus norvegicus]|uniref:RCG34949 n=1 Tax=Rattus norvegicus TaxID=10116 RepID=A6HKF4_RAT|nr:rCG34949 [Rattus norvegicus]
MEPKAGQEIHQQPGLHCFYGASTEQLTSAKRPEADS